MNEQILNKCQLLKEAIEKDPRILLLNQLEKEIENNEEVMYFEKCGKENTQKVVECALKYAHENNIKNIVVASSTGETIKYFKDDQDKIQNAQKLLAESKYNLDIHPLVKQYNKAYLEVKLMYEEINNQLFYIFSSI